LWKINSKIINFAESFSVDFGSLENQRDFWKIKWKVSQLVEMAIKKVSGKTGEDL
jgi:hypothetical protein